MEEQVQDTRDDASLEPRAKCRRRRPECAAREPYALACSTLLTKQRRTNVNVRSVMLIRVMLLVGLPSPSNSLLMPPELLCSW